MIQLIMISEFETQDSDRVYPSLYNLHECEFSNERLWLFTTK